MQNADPTNAYAYSPNSGRVPNDSISPAGNLLSRLRTLICATSEAPKLSNYLFNTIRFI